METTEVLNIPVKHQNVCELNVDQDEDANAIKQGNEDILIKENPEGEIELY